MGNGDRDTHTFPTDAVLMTDPGFKPHFDLFRHDEEAFFAAYAVSHKKLSELGSKFAFKMKLEDDLSEYKAALKKAKKLCEELVKEKSCGPILIRLAWHDSGTYDNANAHKPWPEAGGATASILTDHEMNAGPNNGLRKAATSYLKAVKDQVPEISWADLIQMGSVVGIEMMGGPKIPMKYGRLDGNPQEPAPAPFGLPGALPPFGGRPNGVKDPHDAAEHLRFVFNKYDMDDKDIVALSGAHTVGRAYKDRSGTVAEPSGGGTAYTRAGCPILENSMTSGGRSWTKDWLTFNNSYYADMAKIDRDCITFPTDKVLMTDPKFKPHFDAFAKSQKKFFAAYAVSHKKLSELGCKFDPPEGISDI
jgi:L-ascorbate peroxidase